MTVEITWYIYLLLVFCFVPKLLLFSLQASSCCNHSLSQQYKAANLKTRLFSVAEENEKFKGKSEDYKDLENPTESEPFNLSKKRN